MTDARTITLSDSRKLGYAEYGDRSGSPIFYFHGFPGSRIEARLMNDPAAARNLRLIAVDRPGIGLSDFQPRRRIVDWPRDVSQLSERLGMQTLQAINRRARTLKERDEASGRPGRRRRMNLGVYFFRTQSDEPDDDADA